MENELNKFLIFEEIKRLDVNGIPYWSARDLSKVLGYKEYRNFLPTLERVKESCLQKSQIVIDHFVHHNEMVVIGSKAKRQIETIKLTHYACFLIVQKADQSKEIVALGQSYFAKQTDTKETQNSIQIKQNYPKITQLSQNLEQILFADVASMIEETKILVSKTLSGATAILFWRVGQRVNQEVLHAQRAAYGKQIVVTLSRQLVLEYSSSIYT
jgi:hypothetical protein